MPLSPASSLPSLKLYRDIIYNYNLMVLTKLRARMQNWYSQGMRVGDIFVKMVDFLKVLRNFTTQKPLTDIHVLSKLRIWSLIFFSGVHGLREQL